MMKSLDFRGAWLTPLLTLLAAMVAGMLYAGVALAAPVNEEEPNNPISEAQNIDGAFTLDQDPDIGDTTTNTSTIIPHATVVGTGDDSVDYYSFTVPTPGTRGIFDIDYALDCSDFPCEGFDAWIELYDSNGNSLAAADDAPTEWGQGGSVHPYDSYLEYTFAEPGTYYIAVGSYPGLQPVPAVGFDGAATSYKLQVSLWTTKECKKNGWKNFVNPDGSPMFKNQGDCVSYLTTLGQNEPGKNVPGPGHPEPEKSA